METQDIDVNRIHGITKEYIDYFYERYKMLNSLLAYIISSDYGGVFMISDEEWTKNIAGHNFSTGFKREDDIVYFTGVQNS